MNRDTVKELREAINTTLLNLGEDFGVKIELGNARFGHKDATFQLKVLDIDASGKVFSKEEDNLRVYGRRFGLSPDDLGKSFVVRGRTFTLSGLKPRNTKYPLLAKNSSGTVYKFEVRSYLNNRI